jgi:uncharacterized membrane protein YfcA
MLNTIGLLPESPHLLVYAAIVATFAGFVRGFAGFGFSAFTIAGLSLLISPNQIVPASLLLEVLASLSLLRSVWQDISWIWLKPLILGSVIAIPLGVWSLATLATAPLQIVVSTVILCAAGLLLSGVRPPWKDTAPSRFATGLTSGFFTGLSAVGGMVVATMLFSSPLSAKTSRATLISLFFFSDLYALSWAGGQGLFNQTTLQWVGCLIVPMLIGIVLGQRHFLTVSEARFRQLMLQILAAVAALGLARGLLKQH